MKIKRIAIDEGQRKALFESAGKDSGLTMESVNQIADLFESSMNSKVAQIGKAIKLRVESEAKAKYKRMAQEAVAKNRRALVRKIDMYLEHVVKEWYRKNQSVIENGVSSVQNRRVVEGVLKVLESNYVGLTDKQKKAFESIGKYASRAEKIAESAKSEAVKNRRLAVEAQKRAVLEYASRRLTDTQREKLFEMAKSIRAKNLQEFRNKIAVARKSLATETTRSFAPVRESRQLVTARTTQNAPKQRDAGDIDALVDSAAGLL